MKTLSYNDWWWKLSYKEKRSFTGIIKFNSGIIEYMENGKRHRLDGPAVVWICGYEEYWINGKLLTKLEWLQQTELFQDVLKYKNL